MTFLTEEHLVTDKEVGIPKRRAQRLLRVVQQRIFHWLRLNRLHEWQRPDPLTTPPAATSGSPMFCSCSHMADRFTTPIIDHAQLLRMKPSST